MRSGRRWRVSLERDCAVVGARRRGRRRFGGFRRVDVHARRYGGAGSDDAARHGRFVGGRQDRRQPDAGKNLVGTFKQPACVCASTDTLATLSEREWRCGCAEIAKSAVIESDEFFWMMEHARELAARDEEVVAEAIARSVVFKANVVAQDKTESRGVRECLNYGHTLGHAIETLAGFGTYSHGAAGGRGHAVCRAPRRRYRGGAHPSSCKRKTTCSMNSGFLLCRGRRLPPTCSPP